MNNFKFKSNIKCGGCIATVTPLFNSEPRIEHWEVDLNSADKILTVTTEESEIVKVKHIVEETIGAAGYKIELIQS